MKEFAPAISKMVPNGPCFSSDGLLYVIEQNRVLQYPAAEFFCKGADVAVNVVVPEGKLIATLEVSCHHTSRICGILRINQNGAEREVYATGMGDEIPVGEINRVTNAGQNFGFPWYGGGKTRTNEYKGEALRADIAFPEVEQSAHAAAGY